jgi:hypothetical protein
MTYLREIFEYAGDECEEKSIECITKSQNFRYGRDLIKIKEVDDIIKNR